MQCLNTSGVLLASVQIVVSCRSWSMLILGVLNKPKPALIHACRVEVWSKAICSVYGLCSGISICLEYHLTSLQIQCGHKKQTNLSNCFNELITLQGPVALYTPSEQ